jgi:putative cell wall-binding protein
MTKGRDTHATGRGRATRLLVVALVLAAVVSLAVPASASALSPALQVRQKADGVLRAAPARIASDATADGAEAAGRDAAVSVSAVETGTIGPDGTPVYQYAIALARGDRLTCSLDADTGTDFDLHLLWPDATGPDDLRVAAAAVGLAYPDVLVFDVAQSGSYLLVVHPISGSGDFTLTWGITAAGGPTEVLRIAGADRFQTAVKASEAMFVAGSSADAVLASGSSFADSLSAAGLAGALGCPLLLTQPKALPASVVAELERLGASDVHIVGGTSAVAPAVAEALASAGYDVFRYAGADRYATSAAVAAAVDALSPVPPTRAFVARGDHFADALVVSPLAYSQGYPILLTPTDHLHPAASASVTRSGYEGVIIAGQVTAVSANTEGQLKALLPAPGAVVRVGGPDRYATAEMIARHAIAHYWAVPDWTGLASGADFPDAVAGGAAIGAQGGVLVLTRPATLSSQAHAMLSESDADGLLDHVTIFGGTVAIAAPVETSVRQLVTP